ncbi:MAG: hypothetical protein IPI67_04560 [Myxococcales bacterium]|nr:hypothetical protein [Myxococcales bacterium]
MATATLIALIAALVYVVVSLVVGDRFVFSRYKMYADLTTRDEGAVFYLRAGERFVAADELDAVFGLDVDALDPRTRPCSQQWLVYEAQRWLRDHGVPSAPEGGVAIEAGWRMLRVDQAGNLEERLESVTSGTGRLRA